jgi:hypothetical protein
MLGLLSGAREHRCFLPRNLPGASPLLRLSTQKFSSAPPGGIRSLQSERRQSLAKHARRTEAAYAEKTARIRRRHNTVVAMRAMIRITTPA